LRRRGNEIGTLSKSAEKRAAQSEGEAEGGCGGNSASPEPKRSPATLLVQSRPTKKSFVFLLKEKIGRAQIENRKQNFSLSERVKRAAAGWSVSRSVQKRFALRSVIATRYNFHQFWGKMFARSPRLRLGSLRKFPYISGLNQRDGQNQKSVFCPIGGGSGRQSRQNKNTPLINLLKCFCFPIFSAYRKAALRSQFFNPVLFPLKAEWPKAIY